MAGTFISQSKTRPGAYINFKSAPEETLKVKRGTVIMPLATTWGEEVSEITDEDLRGNGLMIKTGLLPDGSANTLNTMMGVDGALAIKEALKHCEKVLVQRIDPELAELSTASFAELLVLSKYPGSSGNHLKIGIKANGANFDVTIKFHEIIVETFIGVKLTSDIKSNFVEVRSAGIDGGVAALAAQPETSLEGGNQYLTGITYDSIYGTAKNYAWDVMASVGIEFFSGAVQADFPSKTVGFVNEMRNAHGKKVQVVCYSSPLNNEGIISITQGYADKDHTVGPFEFTAYIAGLMASSLANESNTYHEIEGANKIVYEAFLGIEAEPQTTSITPYTVDTFDTALNAGHMLLSSRQDSAIVIEQDNNTLIAFTDVKGAIFRKNRFIRAIDSIYKELNLMFTKSYIGKRSNTDYNRKLFKADCIAYMKELEKNDTIKNFDSSTDIAVLQGTDIDSVVVDMAIQPQDSIEKLYMTVTIG